MHTKFMAPLVAGVALSGCCVSGTGCNAPAVGAQLAWDGMGEAPTANSETTGEQKQPKRRTARNREILSGPLSETQRQSETKARNDEWTSLPNEGPEADAKLARHLKICRNC